MEYPYEDTYDHLRWLLDTFGRERVIWGSDFPNVSHPEFGGMAYEETPSYVPDFLELPDSIDCVGRKGVFEKLFFGHLALRRMFFKLLLDHRSIHSSWIDCVHSNTMAAELLR